MLEPDRFAATQRALESMARQVIRVDLDAFLFHAERVEATGGIVAPAACRGADVGRLVALARAAREFRSQLHRNGVLVARAKARKRR